MGRDKKFYANMGLVLVALIWGSGFAVTKLALRTMGSYGILFYRFLISFLLMALFFSSKFRLLEAKSLKAGLLLGFFMFLGFISQTEGLKYTETGKQGFIIASNVVMVPFIVWAINKKRPSSYDLLAAFFTFMGLAILSFQGSMAGLGKGEILSFISALSFAIHLALIAYFVEDFDPVLLTLLQMLVALVLSFITSIFLEGGLAHLGRESLLPLAYMGVFNTFLAFTIQNMAQKHTTAGNTAIILSMESIFSMIIGILFLGESFSPRHILAFLLVFIGVFISQTRPSFLATRRTRKEEVIEGDKKESIN